MAWHGLAGLASPVVASHIIASHIACPGGGGGPSRCCAAYVSGGHDGCRYDGSCFVRVYWSGGVELESTTA
ncbi:hypothetical protein HDK90DRAFT_489268 [Phyllosticta capitalensis]|uniref:Secreted protein n=1 Tax=Phyllosticta capitalensis TaxID=121624 RepID=A0ABR1YK26_9PEZI